MVVGTRKEFLASTFDIKTVVRLDKSSPTGNALLDGSAENQAKN